MVKDKKCKHERLRIYRTTKEVHCSEVSFIQGNDYKEDDGDYYFEYENNYSNESPDLLNPLEIRVFCSNEKCKKSWEFNPRKRQEYLKLPQFIQQVLSSEEKYIEEHL